MTNTAASQIFKEISNAKSSKDLFGVASGRLADSIMGRAIMPTVLE